MIDSPIATNHFLYYPQDIQKLGETDSKEILIKNLITRKAFPSHLKRKEIHGSESYTTIGTNQLP